MVFWRHVNTNLRANDTEKDDHIQTFLTHITGVLKEMKCTRWRDLPTRPRNRLSTAWTKLASIDAKAALDIAIALKSLDCEERMIPINLREALPPKILSSSVVVGAALDNDF